MLQLSIKTRILDDNIQDLLYNVNINMFRNEISNETLEEAVTFKKTLKKNLYNYEKFRYEIRKINREWSEILTDNFKSLTINFFKAYQNYYAEKAEYEKYLIKFSSKDEEKNLFKFMSKLSLTPKKTICKKR